MTKKKINRNFCLRIIRRKEIQSGIAIAAALAFFLVSCSTKNTTSNSNTRNSTPEKPPLQSEQQQQGIFYETVAQCQEDIAKAESEFKVLSEAFEAGKLTEKPQAPPFKASSCEAQMKAAQAEHERNAPIYKSKSDCESEGVSCESYGSSSRYRPRFGGYYFYPYRSTEYIYLDSGGTRHRVYRPRTVYQGSQAGKIVTPNGYTINRSQPGKIITPSHISKPAPPRPSGTAARGTIRGRSSKGFGSTYKSTGRGGK